MRILSAIAGIIIILIVLGDAFETIILPRRVTRRIRLARLFYRYTWFAWSGIARLMCTGKRQETLLSYFGPVSLLFLLVVWGIGLMFGFALLQWANGSEITSSATTPGFDTDFYLSSTTFLTFIFGDISPRTPISRALAILEAAVGLGFLALVIAYIPGLNQSFSRREVNISLLDSRAGSPPTAGEMIRRHIAGPGLDALQQLLVDWERWSAELLESHLSYPVLAYFRSQHDNQSWVSALAAILDACALLISGTTGACRQQAELTFAMARHAVVDLAIIFRQPPMASFAERLRPETLTQMRETLFKSGLKMDTGQTVDRKLRELRQMYEPYLNSLSRYLIFALPPWIPASAPEDNWQTSPWRSATEKRGLLESERGHF